jgi:hypothetical protein
MHIRYRINQFRYGQKPTEYIYNDNFGINLLLEGYTKVLIFLYVFEHINVIKMSTPRKMILGFLVLFTVNILFHLPILFVNMCISVTDTEKKTSTSYSYEKVYDKFDTDYDREDAFTHKIAMIKNHSTGKF